ncbi:MULTISPECIES: 1,4-dihydroxy-2-naphthoate octaprenyltransferase [Prevotella]|jgi:1,4-dihydroxy-2-naphthoate octaprenyltransferase|uniref:1,4-dihydroxy-2-naphthoate octaprenyltransferase n=1 Tax=Prevotella pectinovora TaxID=1602169 RepID=A0A0D0ITQ6_9BACT|nr:MULTISPECIES: 1,4-dihydroxy-2-naphthoate octaprenyltransferase [Prevotella]KIP54046.1 1,4-dihydroxy-2-naphthoate prenyltransferase [Prevotella pectinovora]KIP56001.1 1,4-dihydroxy-2-naphthoate prenyltransferase [Prevotella pectinovora]KIP60519.1 1,4-dihydroxy-2-naphthoate prenyltransferase [Prevotella pectinovora]MDY4779037.1 1,4-dihydroxy-2-naphthoate octaprenyltransferase [Prevotella pectinovora]CDD05624.1 1 4-dihydroxy-2-naphthoate octaprenyltransferase [Prevotella sp. CAG:592]
MDETNVRVNSLKAWILAARPKTLTGAAVPVMIGIACAVAMYGWCGIRVVPAVLCMLFALIMQVDANFINDYFDFMKGTDDEQRLGPKRACAQGWITASAMRSGLFVTTLLACIVGLPLVYYGGWEMIMVGLACVVFCFLYTISFSYIGLGDLLVLVFFGIVPVCMTYWLTAPPTALTSIPFAVVLMSIACGLIIDTLLVVNNYRDIENDRRAGKLTLIVRIGERGGLVLYLMLGLVGTILAIVGVVLLDWHDGQWTQSLLIIYTPFHTWAFNEMRYIRKGAELNRVLGMTARNMFIFGLLASAALVFAN